MTLSQIYNRLFVCRPKGHKIINTGSCPFTGNTYYKCIRCTYLTFEKTKECPNG